MLFIISTFRQIAVKVLHLTVKAILLILNNCSYLAFLNFLSHLTCFELIVFVYTQYTF